MKNRILSSPILCAIVLSLVVGSPCVSKGQAVVTAPTAPVAPTPVTPAPAASTSTTTTSTTKSTPHTLPYAVVKGDSLTSIAKKFNTTRKHLVEINNLAKPKVTPGQVILIPLTKSPKVVAAAAKAKVHHDYLMAQPVQDFDVPASTFASCPVPLASPDDDADAPAKKTDETAAPVAKLVSPAEAGAAEREAQENPEVTIITPNSPAPDIEEPVPAPKKVVVPGTSAKHVAKATPPPSLAPTSTAKLTVPAAPTLAPFNPPSPHLTARGLGSRSDSSLSSSSNSNSTMTTASNDWGARFLQTARYLGNQGIEYDDDWRPPGESHSWVMDCSNTSRYLYKATANIQLPRTASDQYYYLHLQGKAWDVPQTANGFVDTDYLHNHLKPGDLLFWENTYRPERQPPITHVMVFLGTNSAGQWIMAGSQSSRGGEHNRRNGGPDIYVFRPNQPCGGYTTWMGFVRHHGRFCAFGRPLEADPTKLSVAENN
jgi:cell wall-associated NlpC family hydrolase